MRDEVQAAARMFGCDASELLTRAWQEYRTTPQFVHDYETMQKAFSVGDLDAVTSVMRSRSEERAASRADAVKALRD